MLVLTDAQLIELQSQTVLTDDQAERFAEAISDGNIREVEEDILEDLLFTATHESCQDRIKMLHNFDDEVLFVIPADVRVVLGDSSVEIEFIE